MIRCLLLALFCSGLSLYGQETLRPNIVWIVCEDISPTLSFYGDSTASTPSLDLLASQSTRYEWAFANVGVCAPSRSAIITGMEPTSIGSMHMRAGKDITAWGKRKYKDRIEAVDVAGDSLREYAAVPPPYVKCFPEYLRQAGYFCSNNQKTDYQFPAPLTAWDENGPKAHWRNRPDDQPFFAVFNTNLTHESKLWKHADKPLTVDPAIVAVPPYLPDTPLMRETIARHYSNVELMDAFVGNLIAALKADGLYEQTIIFFYSDHGGPLPRQKREIYDSGLRVPLLVKGMEQTTARTSNQLVSLVDLGPSVLSLAGIEPPDYLQGKAFLGPYNDPRQYVYGSGDRFDEHADRSRMVRDERYLYVHHFFPDLPAYKDINYRKQIPAMTEMLAMKTAGALSEATANWFTPKGKEELFDTQNDPFQLHNLATDSTYVEIRNRMRGALYEHFATQADLGLLPEAEMIELMWPGNQQPVTANPTAQFTEDSIVLSCATPGASIAYQFTNNSQVPDLYGGGWIPYHQAVETPKDRLYLHLCAERIGYQRSQVIGLKLP